MNNSKTESNKTENNNVLKGNYEVSEELSLIKSFDDSVISD